MPAGLDATLVLLRHGESTAIVEGRFQGQLNVPLSPLGLEQARLAAGRLARPHATPALAVPVGPPLEIVHSPLARTSQTAAAVAEAVAAGDAFGEAVPRRPDDGLLEIGQGEWEGRFATEIAERWGELLAEWRTRPASTQAPGGESVAEVQVRVRTMLGRTFGRLAAEYPPGLVERSPVLGYHSPPPQHPWSILVGHDGVFKVLLLTLFELPLERFWLFPFGLCAITIVEVVDGVPRLRAHNLMDHLAVLEEQAQAVSEAREKTGAL